MTTAHWHRFKVGEVVHRRGTPGIAEGKVVEVVLRDFQPVALTVQLPSMVRVARPVEYWEPKR